MIDFCVKSAHHQLEKLFHVLTAQFQTYLVNNLELPAACHELTQAQQLIYGFSVSILKQPIAHTHINASSLQSLHQFGWKWCTCGVKQVNPTWCGSDLRPDTEKKKSGEDWGIIGVWSEGGGVCLHFDYSQTAEAVTPFRMCFSKWKHTDWRGGRGMCLYEFVCESPFSVVAVVDNIRNCHPFRSPLLHSAVPLHHKTELIGIFTPGSSYTNYGEKYTDCCDHFHWLHTKKQREVNMTFYKQVSHWFHLSSCISMTYVGKSNSLTDKSLFSNLTHYDLRCLPKKWKKSFFFRK